MEGDHMLNKLHTKSTMKQQDQASKDKSDALLCQAETRKCSSNAVQKECRHAAQRRQNESQENA
jgi:uncharacterized protein YgbK (DUF1537 family)